MLVDAFQKETKRAEGSAQAGREARGRACMWRLNLVWGQRTKDAGIFLEKRLWRHEAGASGDPHPRPSRTRVWGGLAPGLGPKAEGGHGVCEPREAEGTVDQLQGPQARARALGMFGRPQLTGDIAWKDGRVAASPRVPRLCVRSTAPGSTPALAQAVCSLLSLPQPQASPGSVPAIQCSHLHRTWSLQTLPSPQLTQPGPG